MSEEKNPEEQMKKFIQTADQCVREGVEVGHDKYVGRADECTRRGGVDNVVCP